MCPAVWGLSDDPRPTAENSPEQSSCSCTTALVHVTEFRTLQLKSPVDSNKIVHTMGDLANWGNELDVSAVKI